MQMNDFIKATISVVILIVVVVAVAIPIISGLDNATGENTGETARYDAGGSHMIAVGSDGVTIDGIAVEDPSATTYIVIADTLNVSMSTTGALTLNTVNGTAYATTTIASGGSLSLTNGTATYTATSGGDPTTYHYGKCYVYDESGRYGSYSGATIDALGSATVTAFVASSTQMGFADVRGGQLIDATAYTISSSTATAQTITAVTSGYTENEDGTKTYTVTIPEELEGYNADSGESWEGSTRLNADNMHVVAFISNFDTNNPFNCGVINANICKVGGSVNAIEDVVAGQGDAACNVYSYGDNIYVDGTNVGIDVYTLSGTLVKSINTTVDCVNASDLQSGLYIIKVKTSDDGESMVRKVLLK